jgi:heptosyltransferase-3
MNRAKRVLVIFPGALGDLICLVPTLRALIPRHRGSSIELMAREELARFAVDRMGVAAPHSIDRQEVAVLFSEDADAPSRTRPLFGSFDAIYSFFAHDDATYRRNLTAACRGAVTFLPFRPEGSGHMASRYLACLGEDAANCDARIDLTPDDVHEASQLLAESGISAGKFFLLMPGSGSPEKNWPAEKFLELGHRLAEHNRVAVLLGPAESTLRHTLARTSFALFTDAALGSAAAIARLSLAFVGNDSGISHLAAAAGARGVVLFGSSDPETWRQLGNIKVLKHLPLRELTSGAIVSALAEFQQSSA